MVDDNHAHDDVDQHRCGIWHSVIWKLFVEVEDDSCIVEHKDQREVKNIYCEEQWEDDDGGNIRS